MATAPVSPQDRFAKLVEHFAAQPGVTLPHGGREFGASALKVNNRIFAMLSRQGQLVVKLPRDRVDALMAAGTGGPYDAGKGKPLREWVTVDAARHRQWSGLVQEALDFVRTMG